MKQSKIQCACQVASYNGAAPASNILEHLKFSICQKLMHYNYCCLYFVQESFVSINYTSYANWPITVLYLYKNIVDPKMFWKCVTLSRIALDLGRLPAFKCKPQLSLALVCSVWLS